MIFNFFLIFFKKRRKELGISQEELAKMTGYTSTSSIAKIEGGNVDLPLSKIKEFAKALKIDPLQLLGFEDEDELYNIELKNGDKVKILEGTDTVKMLIKKDKSDKWEQFVFDDYEKQEFEKLKGLNALFFTGKEMKKEDKIELERNLLTAFIKAFLEYKG